jgi:hypothetical protein
VEEGVQEGRLHLSHYPLELNLTRRLMEVVVDDHAITDADSGVDVVLKNADL